MCYKDFTYGHVSTVVKSLFHLTRAIQHQNSFHQKKKNQISFNSHSETLITHEASSQTHSPSSVLNRKLNQPHESVQSLNRSILSLNQRIEVSHKPSLTLEAHECLSHSRSSQIVSLTESFHSQFKSTNRSLSWSSFSLSSHSRSLQPHFRESVTFRCFILFSFRSMNI
jgi:hypothetical protein